MGPISVIIVDDHHVVRIGLKTLLEGQPELCYAGEASSGREAVQLVEQLRPQIVLLDVRMPEMSGIEACREILSSWPQTRVIMLTSYADKDAAMAALMAGACGYLLKQASGEEVVSAVLTAARGGSLVDPMLARELITQLRYRSGQRDSEASLTEQERHVLALVGEGKTNREIGLALYLSEKTVRNYVSNVLHKLGLTNRSQAAAHVVRRQFLAAEE